MICGCSYSHRRRRIAPCRTQSKSYNTNAHSRRVSTARTPDIPLCGLQSNCPSFLRPYALRSARQSSAYSTDATGHGPRWTRREQIEIDGQMYDVCVTVRGDDYVGVWICRECGEHGISALKRSTADQASTRAQIDLCDHHNFVHRRARKLK